MEKQEEKDMLKKFSETLFKTFLIGILCSIAIVTYGKGKMEMNQMRLKGVPIICQYPQLPTGCEATALTMIFNHSGLVVSKQEVADVLPKISLPHYNQGKKRGGHPNEGFIGNPYSRHSYGVYAEPILKVIENYLPGRSQDLRGKSLEQLLEVVKEGRPVMIWATINMANVSYTQSWLLETGETFWWPNNEHALVIVGYDDKWIYMNDPYSGKEKKFLRTVVNNRYNSLGKQAIAILPEAIPLKLIVNEQEVPLEGAKTVLMKQGEILVPLCYLDELGIITQYHYVENACEWQIPNVQNVIQLKEKEGIGVGYLEDGTKIKIYYELEAGITRVNLKDLLTFSSLEYEINEDALEVQLPCTPSIIENT